MNIAEEIVRLNGAKADLSEKGVELGISLATDKIDAIGTKFKEKLVKVGSINQEVQEGDTYNIPQGYHDGSGTVSGIAGGGNYKLEEKTATPTKAEQAIVTSDGFYGISSVTIAPIPDEYQDVSGVTATADKVLTGSDFVNGDGDIVAGTMVDNGTADLTIDGLTETEVVIPAGYYAGGKVALTDDIANALAAI